MKRFLLIACITMNIFGHDQNQSDQTEKYRTMKAHEAIIYDTYQEAIPFEGEIPQAWQDAIIKFGLDLNDIHFYTAVRMNRFVEKVGNNIILLRPNFFLYLTEQEQAAYIGIQLARIKDGDNKELGGKHDPKKQFTKRFQKVSAFLTVLLFVAIYRKELKTDLSNLWDYIRFTGLPLAKDILLSPAGMLASAFLAYNGLAKVFAKQEELKDFLKYEFDCVDTLGAEGLVAARERQVGWGKRNASWISYQWHKLLAQFYLEMMPEVELERIQEHVAKK